MIKKNYECVKKKTVRYYFTVDNLKGNFADLKTIISQYVRKKKIRRNSNVRSQHDHVKTAAWNKFRK